jgi:indoleacetamide hydrolase
MDKPPRYGAASGVVHSLGTFMNSNPHRSGICPAFLAALACAASAAAAAAPAAAVDARAVCTGKAKSETLVSAAIARARAVATLNAFVMIDEAGALATARAIDAGPRAGKCRPLAGVPIVIKDNIHVAGLPATAGTPALKAFVPQQDAPVVQRLRAAGAVVIGKTNMHELAFGISGYNPAYNTGPEPGVRNAYDRSKVAGGSSSGTAAALGARVVAAGLGTDTGGSVRVPCAFNGCASLRPTVGRYSQEGIAPISRTRDTAGPMAASMVDVELMDRVISGAPRAAAVSLKTVRLGLVKPMLANMDADTQQAFDAALAKLKSAGVRVVEVEMPQLNEINGAVSFPVAMFEAYDDMVTYLGLVIPRKLPAPNNTLVDAAPLYDAATKTARPALQALYRNTFKTHRLDALVFPTVPKVAFAANADASSVPTFMATIQNTDPGSNAGVPGIQIPVALGVSSKLPIGIELDGPTGSDRRLLAIGIAIEKRLGRIAAP